MYQIPETEKKDRRDHVWLKVGENYKCVTCGAIAITPPNFPTPEEWLPEKYDVLTDEERILSGFKSE